MRIVHHVALVATASIQREIADLGLDADFDSDGHGAFDIDEADPRWSQVRDALSRWDAGDLVHTEFTEEELRRCVWLRMLATSPQGYPQPDEHDDGYLDATYDLTTYCSRCGIGLVQKAPFQMKGEPRWGRRGIIQMYWVPDAFFVQPAVWETIFKPLGVACRPVLHHRTKRELSTVVQVDPPISEVTAELSGYPGETCPACHRWKYAPVTRGPFPPLRGVPAGHMVLTPEEFGSGAASYHGVLISQQLYQSLLEHKVRGAKFAVVAEN